MRLVFTVRFLLAYHRGSLRAIRHEFSSFDKVPAVVALELTLLSERNRPGAIQHRAEVSVRRRSIQLEYLMRLRDLAERYDLLDSDLDTALQPVAQSLYDLAADGSEDEARLLLDILWTIRQIESRILKSRLKKIRRVMQDEGDPIVQGA